MKYLEHLFSKTIAVLTVTVSPVFAHGVADKTTMLGDLIHRLTSTHHVFIFIPVVVAAFLVTRYIYKRQ